MANQYYYLPPSLSPPQAKGCNILPTPPPPPPTLSPPPQPPSQSPRLQPSYPHEAKTPTNQYAYPPSQTPDAFVFPYPPSPRYDNYPPFLALSPYSPSHHFSPLKNSGNGGGDHTAIIAASVSVGGVLLLAVVLSFFAKEKIVMAFASSTANVLGETGTAAIDSDGFRRFRRIFKTGISTSVLYGQEDVVTAAAVASAGDAEGGETTTRDPEASPDTSNKSPLNVEKLVNFTVPLLPQPMIMRQLRGIQ